MITALVLSALMLAGCADDDDDIKPYIGYINPGEFRPQGILDDKEYYFDFLEGPGDNCGPSDICLAVYTNWYGTYEDMYYQTEGIAISDRYKSNPVLDMKIYRITGLGDWTISLIYNGIAYSGTAPVGAISIEFSDSTIQTYPEYTTPLGDYFEASGIYVQRATIKFMSDIPLKSKSSTITIDCGDTPGTGDRIVAYSHRL
ncbi:MAG: hypothetical protein JW807_04740 [Spirochaetes bacterium]|nr:hypothetical protein [Spirochaetota bacterium]